MCRSRTAVTDATSERSGVDVAHDPLILANGTVLAGLALPQLSVLRFYKIGVPSGILFSPAYQSPKVPEVVPTMVMNRTSSRGE